MKQKTDAWNSMSFFATQNKNVWKASEHKSEALHWQIQLGLTSIFLRVSCDSAKHENCKSINLLSGFSPTLTYTTPHQNWPNLSWLFSLFNKKIRRGMCFQQAETNTSGRWHRKSSSAAMSWFSGTISASASRRIWTRRWEKTRRKVQSKTNKKTTKKKMFLLAPGRTYSCQGWHRKRSKKIENNIYI